MRHLPRSGLASLCLLAAAVTATANSKSRIDELGANTYAVTREATTAFDRDVEKFKREAQEDAVKFCAEKGKTMKIVAVTTDRPYVGVGYTQAKLTFKALDANDPELTASPPAAAAAAPGPATASGGVTPATLPTAPGDLYTEILKLDDLRKRGLLTDKEFEQEKKKLLKKNK
jgi:hypothetical protein